MLRFGLGDRCVAEGAPAMAPPSFGCPSVVCCASIIGCASSPSVTVSVCSSHSLANWDSGPSPAKSEAIEYLQVGPTEIRYSVAWMIFVYLQRGQRKQKYSQI